MMAAQRAWWVRIVMSVEMIRFGLFCDEILDSKPPDAGRSRIDKIKIRPIDPDAVIPSGYVEVFARGVEL